MIDKKKTYIKPLIEVADIEPTNMICTSVLATEESTLSTNGYEEGGEYEAGSLEW